MDLLSQMNDKQREAVLHKDGPLLLLAGAGSGKTRVITHRIAYLIENGVSPWNILAITFTNKAAKEMRERVDKLVEDGAESVWISTFHSMCVRILRKDIDKLGYDRSFAIYDSDDQERLVKECIQTLQYNDKQFVPKGVMAEISSCKNELINSEMYEKQAGSDFRQSRIANIYSMYQRKLKSNNALDFDDLIFRTIDLFKAFPEVLEVYQNRCRYIMVDEYQDTNTAQYQLVRYLADKYENLCVVGDDDQSIYGWRGANIRNILDFEKDFKNTVTIKLEQNYRSTQNILNAANAVISHNKGRKVKALWTQNEKGKNIFFRKLATHFEEGAFIAEEVKNGSGDGRKYSDYAVLYRTNAQSRAIEEQLIKAGIPYRLLGGTRFYDRKEIKDIMSYLKVINNPVDDLAVKRIINVPRRGIGDTTIGKVSAYAFEKDINFFTVLTKADEIYDLGRSAKKLKEFADFIGVLRYEAQEKTVDELIKNVIERSGYKSELELEGTDEAKGRLENINELISKAAEYEKETEGSSLSGFLEEVALVADIDNYEAEADSIVLMTLHSAKGLEFPCVFIAGVEEGIFPSYRSIVAGSEAEVEEERRLCYVGITRAKQQLYMLCANSRMINGKVQYNMPSRFLKELPIELLDTGVKKPVEAVSKPVPEKVSYRPQFEKTKPYEAVTNAIPAPKNVNVDLEVGDKVKHMKFGIGEVKAVSPAGADYEIVIDFEKAGVKRLMFTFAKLEKIQ